MHLDVYGRHRETVAGFAPWNITGNISFRDIETNSLASASGDPSWKTMKQSAPGIVCSRMYLLRESSSSPCSMTLGGVAACATPCGGR
jgi:hypothetical protein